MKNITVNILSLDSIISNRNHKSFEATRFLKSRMSEVVKEDKQVFDRFETYTLNEIDLFCSADLEITDITHGRRINIGI